MGACLGKNNEITVKGIKKGINNNKNNKNKSIPKRKKFIATLSLDKMCIHFQEINKYNNNLPILYSENNPNILDITDVINEYSHEDNRNNTTSEEILELFN